MICTTQHAMDPPLNDILNNYIISSRWSRMVRTVVFRWRWWRWIVLLGHFRHKMAALRWKSWWQGKVQIAAITTSGPRFTLRHLKVGNNNDTMIGTLYTDCTCTGQVEVIKVLIVTWTATKRKIYLEIMNWTLNRSVVIIIRPPFWLQCSSSSSSLKTLETNKHHQDTRKPFRKHQQTTNYKLKWKKMDAIYLPIP